MSGLLPAESIALTVALAQVQRGDEPTPNIAAVCVYALARLDGRYDWTADEAADLGSRSGGDDECPMNRPFYERLFVLLAERLTDTELLAHLSRMSDEELDLLVAREAANPWLTLPSFVHEPELVST